MKRSTTCRLNSLAEETRSQPVTIAILALLMLTRNLPQPSKTMAPTLVVAPSSLTARPSLRSSIHAPLAISPRMSLSWGDDRQGSVVEAKEGRADANSFDRAASSVDGEGDAGEIKTKRSFTQELRRSFWLVATYSWLNVLLVFVPVGIVVGVVKGVNGGIVFAINCIAVIPLAGLLSHATESVASKMGDSLGALLNVTFGNAVELIIFIIALVKNEIRIVQASLLGSILANLLLILGMGFFLGGLRYREQVGWPSFFKACLRPLKFSCGKTRTRLLTFP